MPLNHETTSIWNWCTHIQSLNSLLIKTSSFIDNDKLCKTLKAGLDKDLLICCDDQKNGITGLHEWCLAVKHVDESHCHELKHMCKLTESLMNKCCMLSPSGKFNTTASTPSSRSTPCLLHLTDDKHQLLFDHAGCLKCQHFQASHMAKDCLVGFPNVSTYKTLMLADIPKAGSSSKIEPLKCQSTAKTVAAIGKWADDDGDVSFRNIAVVLPSAVLSSDDDSNSADENTVSPAPFCS